MNYESRTKKNKAPIVILHGWGLRGSTYKDLVSIIEKEGHFVYSPDLPGFGTEPLVHGNMMLDDYVVFLRKFIEKNKIAKPILIGHSFGGRVAIKYAWRYSKDLNSLILTGVPIIRHTSLKRKIAYITAVVGGKIFQVFPKETKMFLRKILYFAIGEWDYYKAGPLQQVFKNIIGEDLTMYAKSISVPTLLVWGEDDRIVSASDARKIKKHIITHAATAIVEGGDHKLPYISPKSFIKAIQSVL